LCHTCQAYDAGFGPLTSQAIPTLLAKAGFPGDLPSGGGGFLDVATGPGYVTLAAIEAANKTAAERRQAAAGGGGDGDISWAAPTFTALDFSGTFLALAAGRVGGQCPGVPVAFVEGSAEVLPFANDTFDAIACNFGILHLSDPDAFLRESLRCLRPGGRLSFSVWAAPPVTEAFALVLGSVSAKGNPDVPLPAGPPFFRFADAPEVARSLAEAGFEASESVVVENMRWANVSSAAQLYDVFLEGTARTRALLEGQTPVEAKAVQAEVAKRFQALLADVEGGGGGATRPLRMPAVVSSGRKPLAK